MREILCFGDSNTWGYIPGGAGRYSNKERWTCILQRLLGDDYHIIEEGLNGRTTAFSDYLEPYRCGLEYIAPCVLSHFPLDIVVIMLGTNDCKARYHASATEIRYGMEELVKKIRFELGQKGCNPNILIVAPASIRENDSCEFDENSISKSEQLAEQYQDMATMFGCEFLDAKEYGITVGCDGFHLTREGHQILAEAIKNKIMSL